MGCGCGDAINMSGGGKSLQDKTVTELRQQASRYKIAGRSKLTRKADLIAAIRKYHKQVGEGIAKRKK